MRDLRLGRRPQNRIDDRVLSALVGPAAHGFAVAARLRAAGTVPAGAGDGQDLEGAEGTVYPVLHRLERLGLVRSVWADVAGRRRRVYELTGAGATALERATVAAAVVHHRSSAIGRLVGRPA